MKKVQVVVGIIKNNQQKILLTQRPFHKPQGGLWEFPGGKVELNELPENALEREFKEELGVTLTEYKKLGEITHNYPELKIHLLVFEIEKYLGTPQCLENQPGLCWVYQRELSKFELPEANQEIIALLNPELTTQEWH